MTFEDNGAYDTRNRVSGTVSGSVLQAGRVGNVTFNQYGRPGDEPSRSLRRILPHDEVVRGLLGRRTYLTGGQLPFVSPGPGHEADPGALLRRLSAPEPRGVLLIGPAGAGKTRTCYEVAEAAHRAGWRVLHVQPHNSVTVDDLAHAVLGAGCDRVLLLFDYLDTCSQVDLQVLANSLLPEAKRTGVAVAVIASVRPSGHHDLLRRGSAELFDDVALRQDEDHQSRVVEHILREVAPVSLRRWGMAALSRTCGRRPVIALLIARALEQLLAAGHTDADLTRVRRGELHGWLQEALRRDRLTAARSREPATPLDRVAPDTWQLAAAVAVAVCPQARAAVEGAVDSLLDREAGEHPGRLGGRRVVDTLLSLGWMDETDGELYVVHDIVVDELVAQVLFPPPGFSIDDQGAGALFAAATERVRSLARFAGHLRRLTADLAADGIGRRAAVLERFCHDWVMAHANRLGGRLERSGKDGEQALLTMVTSPPWKNAAAEAWQELVQPWLNRAEESFSARPFLDAALSDDRNAARPLIEGALSWLSRRGQQTDADHVIRALLGRTDLSPAEEQLTVECALEWVREHPGWQTTPAVLNLVLSRRHQAERLTTVAQCVLDWLRPRRRTEAGIKVLKRLLEHDGLPGGLRRTVVAQALSWSADSRGAGSSATVMLFQAVVACQGVESDQERMARDLAVAWLSRYGVRVPEAGSLLSTLLLSHSPDHGDVPEEVIAVTFGWLDANRAASVQSGRVIQALLWLPQTSGEQLVRAADLAVAELRDRPAQPALIGCLLSRREGLTPGQARFGITRALEWCESHPTRKAQRPVLSPLLRRSDLEPGQAARAIDAGLDRLARSTAGSVAREILCGLLERRDLSPSQSAAVLEHTTTWLHANGSSPRAAFVVLHLLERSDLPPDVEADAVRRAEAALLAPPAALSVPRLRAQLDRRRR
ncbi:ATP-binding protein [Kitasatospora sp. NPDC093558]|uniref:ATP-binding protein n=1 Tax=Kitasatospora sp. NPDC093558 TaxID=3155201 RepID=UPI0034205928